VVEFQRFKIDLKKFKTLEEAEIPDGGGLQFSKDRVVQLESWLVKFQRLEKVRDSLALELEVVDREEAELLRSFGELGVCPTCSQSIDAGHCLHLEE
jgi:hypothetical protein